MKPKPSKKTAKKNTQAGQTHPAQPHTETQAEPTRAVSSEGQTHSRSYAKYVVAGCLAVFAALVFSNSLSNGFVFDDRIHLLERPLLRSLGNLPELLRASYRPVRNISYAIDFAVWGEAALGFHLTNVLIHAANVLLVFAVARRVTGDLLWAGLATLIFAVHPMQPDSVTYISGRRDLLFSLFYLSSFLFYLSFHKYVAERNEHFKWHIAAIKYLLFIGSWALSLMSKEMAASLPLFLLVWSFCQLWGESGGSWKREFWSAFKGALKKDKWLYAAVALSAPLYAWYTIFVTGASLRARFGFQFWGGDIVSNALTALRVHAWYLKQLVLPTPFVQYLGAFDISTSFTDLRAIFALFLVAAALAGGVALLAWDKRLTFAVFSYFVLLLPVSHIVPHHELLADHYLYLPLMSFGLFVAVLLQRLSEKNAIAFKAAVAVGIALTITFSVITYFRNTVYKDDLSLWEANYKEAPNSIRAMFNLASQYSKRFPARAGELFEKCIQTDPTYSPAYPQLAKLYQSRDKARVVEELSLRGLALPDSAIIAPGREHPAKFRSDLTFALAVSKASQGDAKAGEELMLKALELWPANPEPYELLSVYYRQNDPPESSKFSSARSL